MMHAICINSKCCQPFTPRNTRQLYCSRRCSAHVRNRRYRATPKGRKNKRLSASRYFQNHKAERYAEKERRLQRYCEEYRAECDRKLEAWREQIKQEPDPEMKARYDGFIAQEGHF